MPKVTFHAGGQTTEAEAESGKTVLQIALDNGILMEHACGGNGFCTTCLCKVKSGVEGLNERNDKEENMGITEDHDRLGCQATVQGDVEIEVLDA
ncbi:MAG: 2Fe-2S iron-sulfur cluster-binding protein [Candidatus Peribacteraceae bacterium]|jgi:2Fe-2S ferredoxin|nr:2Fe-2S iron-sulfur cluster-binding protein [Candidatus Peribacteraceae bacterium]MDP7477458.1 2Fe-2S iron-sulfur cluster-binding protein [Candidatus Peribacteraceae bacterium]